MSHPGSEPAGATTSGSDRWTTSTSAATPARAALVAAAWAAPSSRSLAMIGTVADARGACDASVATLDHVPGSNDGQSPNAKLRRHPGGTLRAIIAASIAIVPEPHIG